MVCGSFGRGAEGHLLACSQCSQCYHPYCVNSKVRRGPRTPSPITELCCAPQDTRGHAWHVLCVELCSGMSVPSPGVSPRATPSLGTPVAMPRAHVAALPRPQITKVMLLKGWRCVECIVCEVCGKASDPSRLLLCDDCDISYHTYCLDPPLQTVPKGGWKCKWCVGGHKGSHGGSSVLALTPRGPLCRCVCCVQCGAASPGFHCEWQNNYTHCAPCASLVVCPFCREKYVEDDLLIQCRHCDR